jgi:hypothetical protein
MRLIFPGLAVMVTREARNFAMTLFVRASRHECRTTQSWHCVPSFELNGQISSFAGETMSLAMRRLRLQASSR